MVEVQVMIKPEIARAGGGFYDIAGKQELYPPRKSGKPILDHVFRVKETPFIRQKIGTGELVVIKRDDLHTASETGNSQQENNRPDGDMTYFFQVNGETVHEVTVPASTPENELLEMFYSEKKVQKAIGKKEIAEVKHEPGVSINARTK